jgi:hypothetical protein
MRLPATAAKVETPNNAYIIFWVQAPARRGSGGARSAAASSPGSPAGIGSASTIDCATTAPLESNS